MWYGVVQCIMVLCSVLWCCAVYYGVVQCAMVLCSVLWCCAVCHGVVNVLWCCKCVVVLRSVL